ncbi:hypothetical protein [Streptomyces sp. NPDC003401]
MSSVTLATTSAVPDPPEHADVPQVLPHRRTGRWAAAVAAQHHVENHHARGAERTR